MLKQMKAHRGVELREIPGLRFLSPNLHQLTLMSHLPTSPTIHQPVQPPTKTPPTFPTPQKPASTTGEPSPSPPPHGFPRRSAARPRPGSWSRPSATRPSRGIRRCSARAAPRPHRSPQKPRGWTGRPTWWEMEEEMEEDGESLGKDTEVLCWFLNRFSMCQVLSCNTSFHPGMKEQMFSRFNIVNSSGSLLEITLAMRTSGF